MCCPARKATGSGGARMKLLMRGVRGTIPATTAFCHGETGGRSTSTSVVRVALLAPWVAVHVVAAQLPEAGLVPRGELQPLQPLGRLPEVEVRHEQPRRPAVVGLERPA